MDAHEHHEGRNVEAHSDSWYPISLGKLRDWASTGLGDVRQVHARDVSAHRDAPLVFMPDGHAGRFAQAAQEGRLVCPVPGCTDPRLSTRRGRDHFVHSHAPEHRHGDCGPEMIRQLLHRWAVGQDYCFEVVDGATVAGVPTTVLVRLTSGRQVALCCTNGELGVEAWQRQHVALERAAIAGVWLFPPRQPWFAEPNARSALAAKDAEGAIRDVPLFKAMRREGSWPLIVNIEQEELANLVVPGRKVAKQLDLPRPPFAGQVLHVIVSPLTSCKLCDDGIATTAVNMWHLRTMREGYRQHMARCLSEERRAA